MSEQQRRSDLLDTPHGHALSLLDGERMVGWFELDRWPQAAAP
jgi:hypothetical protein